MTYIPWLTAQRMTELVARSEEHTSELQSRRDLVCRLLLEKKKTMTSSSNSTVTEGATTKIGHTPSRFSPSDASHATIRTPLLCPAISLRPPDKSAAPSAVF